MGILAEEYTNKDNQYEVHIKMILGATRSYSLNQTEMNALKYAVQNKIFWETSYFNTTEYLNTKHIVTLTAEKLPLSKSL